MLEDLDSGNLHLTKSEFNLLRQKAAANGFVITEADIADPEKFYEAVLKALPEYLMQDIAEYLTTGSSPFTTDSTQCELSKPFDKDK